VVADFLVGAHAAHAADRLLTRGRGFFRRYFDDLMVLDPSRDPAAAALTGRLAHRGSADDPIRPPAARIVTQTTEGSTVPAYATEIAVRWSDMDAFGHVNNARIVTLLEGPHRAALRGRGAGRCR
jgi:hypothetical protein